MRRCACNNSSIYVLNIFLIFEFYFLIGRKCEEVCRFLNQILCKPVEVLVIWLFFYSLYYTNKNVIAFITSAVARSKAWVPCVEISSVNKRVRTQENQCYCIILKKGVTSNLLCSNRRYDLTDALKKLQCRTLIFVGENSPFHSEALYMTTKVDRRYSALVEVCHEVFPYNIIWFLSFPKAVIWYLWFLLALQVQSCGSLVTEEQPHAMLIPLEYFLMGYELYRPSQQSYSPRGPLSPTAISPELLSPESMGVKLKPIRTRISLQVWNFRIDAIYSWRLVGSNLLQAKITIQNVNLSCICVMKTIFLVV